MIKEYLINKYKLHFKLWYSDNGENGIKFCIEEYDYNLQCDQCGKIGSWFMINEKYPIGSCFEHIKENIGKGKMFKKLEINSNLSFEGIN